MWWIGILWTLLACGCDSDNSVKPTLQQLTKVSINDTRGSIVLNNETMPDAYAYFETVPSLDAVKPVKIVLCRVHPTEKIEMEVSATGNSEGNIVFEGEQMVNDVRHIKVKGLYRASQTDDDSSEKSSKIKINVSYTVPNSMFSKEYVIPFDGCNGFCYNRDPGQYPMSDYDIEGQRDSCEWICKKINSELARDIKSLSFKFEDNGQLTLGYTTPKLDVFKQSFRYWLRLYGDKIYVNIENPGLFYGFLLNALNLSSDQSLDKPSYLPEYETAEIYIEGCNYLNNFKFNRSIVIRDDLRYKVFSYVRDKFENDGTLSEKEKGYLNTMENVAKRNYDGREYSISIYEWAFAIWEH